MKKIYLLLLLLFTFGFSFSQIDVNQLFSNHPEVIIKFQIQDRSELEYLTKIMSIDNVKGNGVIAYTVKEEFVHFLTLDIPFEIVEKSVLSPEELNMMEFEVFSKNRDWDSYPTYDTYISMMQQFENDYPDICKRVEFGTSVQNRKLLACVISKNVNIREAEPQVFWTASMHGNETCGFVLMLRYIDYLLRNYGTNEQITYLLDNLEIWINPSANPDGTYWGGNHTVSGSRRGNANNVDLNRNYKDWKFGDHPDGKAWQKETLAFMDLQNEETFVLGANIHGGEEVCNYPWDNSNAYHADNSWWYYVCREYADTVHKYNPYYMTGFNNGIVRGWDWYSISGGRQDYANYYDFNREFCLEISDTWITPAGQLTNYWNGHHRSFLNYTQQALYGIHGVVTNACSGEPVYAKISLPTDINNSFVWTDPRVGFYARPIKGGTYQVTYSADGYTSQTVSITVSDKQKVVQNIALIPVGISNLPIANFEADEIEIFQNDTVRFTDLSENATSWEWFFEEGTPQNSTEQNPTVVYENHGVFDVKLRVINADCSNEKTIEKYITVNRLPNMPFANFEADKTEIMENETVSFTNLSINAIDWEWYFEGGFPETSNEQNPTVLYTNQGNFDVKLTVSNSDGNDEMVKENYIAVKELKVDEAEEIKIRIYPNPLPPETLLTIETDLSVSKIELINLLGELVTSKKIETPPYSLSVSGIDQGLYIIRITTTNSVYSTKIQIQQ
jgi:PKD repeat protein